MRAYTERDVREIFQVREAIEGLAARLAAENIHRADYATRLRACRRRLHETGNGSIAELTDARQLFHDLLYEIAGNAVLTESAMRLTFPLNRLLFNELAGNERAQESLKEHDEIIDAVLAGNGTRAERAMRLHLHNGAIAVCEVLERLRTAAAGVEKSVEQKG